MPSQTSPNEYPYPLGNEPVADSAAAAQALAQAVDDHVGLHKSGSVGSGTLVANTYSNVNVTFTTPFPAAGPVPNVTVSVGGTTSTELFGLVTAVTRSGFTINMKRVTGTAAITAQWHATNVGDW